MNAEIVFVFTLLLLTIILFVSDKVRLDIVAIGVILVLMLSGLLTPVEALSGFADPVVLLIAGLFVIGEGLYQTGIAFAVGHWLMRVAGTHEVRLMVMLMLVVAGLSAFMSSTGAVAIFIPIVLSLSVKAGINPSRLLLPIALASLIGAMLTLIGTPPNLVVSTQLEREGLEPFGFFSFTPIGLTVLVCGIIYMLLVGRYQLPKRATGKPKRNQRSIRELADAYAVRDKIRLLQLGSGSSLVGQSIEQARLLSRYGIVVIGIEHNKLLNPALSSSVLSPNDALLVFGKPADLEHFRDKEQLTELPLDEYQVQRVKQELGLAEVLLTPNSHLIGQTLIEADFRQHYDLTVLGIQRLGQSLQDNFTHIPLAFGDSVLVAGGWQAIAGLKEGHDDFLVLNLPEELAEVAPGRHKSTHALVILAVMLVLMTFNLVPNVAAVLLAALATAPEKTGAVSLIANALVAAIGDFGPFALMAGLFVLTSVFSQFISNTATTVLIAPIAVAAASALNISIYPILMTVAIAASTAFVTPVASPVNTLILGPGGYKFMDFVKVGVSLQILAMIVTLLLVPVIFPLAP